MTYEIYRYIFLGSAILAVIMLIVSILVFILLKIPTVIGDLTGANARKAIENIRNQTVSTQNTGNLSSRSPHRGRLTDKISLSGTLHKNHTNSLGISMQTAKISTQQLTSENQADQTTLLSAETTVLSPETTVLAAETTVLGQPQSGNETAVLSQDMLQAKPAQQIDEAYASQIVIEYEITYIHTDEIIA